MHRAGPACLFIYSQRGPWLHNDGNWGMPGKEKLFGGRGSLGCRAGSGEHPGDTQLDRPSHQGSLCSSCGPDGICARENTEHFTTGGFPSPACPQMPPPTILSHGRTSRGMRRASHTQLLPTQLQSCSAGVSRALFSSARLLVWS